jgi:hypothetical protein
MIRTSNETHPQWVLDCWAAARRAHRNPWADGPEENATPDSKNTEHEPWSLGLKARGGPVPTGGAVTATRVLRVAEKRNGGALRIQATGSGWLSIRTGTLCI